VVQDLKAADRVLQEQGIYTQEDEPCVSTFDLAASQSGQIIVLEALPGSIMAYRGLNDGDPRLAYIFGITVADKNNVETDEKTKVKIELVDPRTNIVFGEINTIYSEVSLPVHSIMNGPRVRRSKSKFGGFSFIRGALLRGGQKQIWSLINPSVDVDREHILYNSRWDLWL
jgi:hypothetical protein